MSPSAPNALRPAATSPRPYHFPDFERRELPSGLKVWLVPIPAREMVHAHLLVDAGASSESEEGAGIAALTAQLLVTGTQRLDAAEFAEATERLGIEVSSESSWDSARAGFASLAEHLDAGLDLLAEMVLTPRLDGSEFERLRGERLNEILQARAEPGRLAEEMFLRHVYAADVPYRRLSGGIPETIEALGVDDARRHHAEAWQPASAHLIMAGAIDPDAAYASAERAFGGWTGDGIGHRTIEPRPAGARRVVLVDRPGSVQSELRVGHIGIDRHHAQYFPALVMSSLLGGVFGSRLNLRLREELGYTYGARCGFDPRRAAGPFTASAAAPEDAELREVRDFLIGVFPLRFETSGGVASAIEPIAIYGLPDDWWQTYRAHTEAVGTAEAHAAARDLIRPDELLVLLTGDAAKIRGELEAADFGPLEVVTEG